MRSHGGSLGTRRGNDRGQEFEPEICGLGVAPDAIGDRNSATIKVDLTKANDSPRCSGNDCSGINNNWGNIDGMFPAAGKVTAFARGPGWTQNLDTVIYGNGDRRHTSRWKGS
ncbi:hypothetical protein [Rhodococcus sp. CH91]|uniref:hypothetical protein n=1 Tax=Rhodococcus sp. CH91 TaxID=2910256 RepID=UPI001F4B44B6|nr:hypothetical protein [Rhodococcus sp. CH91]